MFVVVAEDNSFLCFLCRFFKRRRFFRQFAPQFKDFMILTLLAAAGISFFASYAQGEVNLTDPLIILAIVILNALLGIYQEKRQNIRRLTFVLCKRHNVRY